MSDRRRHVVWVCCGCDDCEPLDGSEPSRYPCRNSPSSNGAEVVLAEDYDRLRAALDLIAEHARLDESERGFGEASRYYVIAEDAIAKAGLPLRTAAFQQEQSQLQGEN